jgi:hypothetical protein
LAACWLLGAQPARADATFTDSTFSGYTVGFSASQGSATFTAAQCAACGDPTSALELTINSPAGSNLGAAVVNNLFTYNPQTQGGIASISASVDKNFNVTSTPAAGFNSTFRPVIEQDGNFYTAVSFGTPVTVLTDGGTATSGYVHFTLTNLQATDFLEFDTSTGLVGTANPNFSGDAITFGIGQVLAANAYSETLTSDFDNLSITVTTAVPEPSGLVLMLTGLGLVGLVANGSRRAKTLG